MAKRLKHKKNSQKSEIYSQLTKITKDRWDRIKGNFPIRVSIYGGSKYPYGDAQEIADKMQELGFSIGEIDSDEKTGNVYILAKEPKEIRVESNPSGGFMNKNTMKLVMMLGAGFVAYKLYKQYQTKKLVQSIQQAQTSTASGLTMVA